MPAQLLDNAPRLERKRGMPVHAQIERWLTDVISSGELGPGERLPGERHLAAALRVSRMTLRQALDGLARRGVLVRLPGRAGGAFVAEPKIDCELTGATGPGEQVRRQRRVSARVLSASTVPAGGAVAAALGLTGDAPVHEVVRVRCADGFAHAVERSWYPADALPGLLDLPLTGSVPALLGEHYRLVPGGAVQHLEPVTAGPADAAALDVPVGSALMCVERTARCTDGRPIEFARDVYRADRVRLVVRTGAPVPRATTDHALLA